MAAVSGASAAFVSGRQAGNGELGCADARHLTAVGDVVNTASRLGQPTKGFGAQLVVSEAVAQHSGLDFATTAAREIAIRGRGRPLAVRIVAAARTLPEQEPPARVGQMRHS
jgi:adenylate cyclase